MVTHSRTPLRITGRLCLAAALGWLWLGMGADAAASGPTPVIEYGYPEQPPRAFTNEHGQPDGSYPRLLKILFAKANMNWHATSYPAPRLMKNLGTGETNFSILVKNSQLEKCCIYSTKPVWNDELRIYYIGNKPPILNKESLNGKDLITIAGFSYGGFINYLSDPANHVHTNPAESHYAAFAMLDAGRADYLLDYSEPATSEGLSRHPIANLHSDTLDVAYMYFVIAKSYPNASATLERLEAIYEAMRTEDTQRAYTR
jgi:hypothetical protein